MESFKLVKKQKGLILLILCMLLSVYTISASLSYEKDTAVDIKLSTNLTNCNITISYPNSTNAVIGKAMSINKGYANYTLSNTQTDKIGEYTYFSECGYNSFYITYSGETLTTAGSILNLGFLALLILLFIANLIAFLSIDSGDRKSVDGVIVDINNLKYLKGVLFGVGYALLIAVFFIASNIAMAYLSVDLFGKVLFVIYRILFLTALPIVVVWLIWLFVNIFQDKETRNLIERGVQFGGKNDI